MLVNLWTFSWCLLLHCLATAWSVATNESFFVFKVGRGMLASLATQRSVRRCRSVLIQIVCEFWGGEPVAAPDT